MAGGQQVNVAVPPALTSTQQLPPKRGTGRPALSAICFIALDAAADANAALRNAKLRFLMNGYYGMFACLLLGPFGEVGGGWRSF